jgi:hypothetical protein
MIEWEIDELVGVVCGKSEDETDQAINDGHLDIMIEEKYGVSLDQYYEIVKDLMPFTPIVKTALTEDKYHAFVGGNPPRMIVRLKVESD